MRKKRYAVLGLRSRLQDPTLTGEQRAHSVQTLALITGRKFHREAIATALPRAQTWLNKHLS
jgi:hypothetical protein